MFPRLLLLLLVVPVVELFLLYQIGGAVGFWPTMAILILTAVSGSLLLRHEGTSAWRRFSSRLQQGHLPGDELLDGMIILVCGVLLITPGVLTDLFGLLGLFPPTRALVRKQLSQTLKGRISAGSVAFGTHWQPTKDSMTGDAHGWQGAAKKAPGHQIEPPDPFKRP